MRIVEKRTKLPQLIIVLLSKKFITIAASLSLQTYSQLILFCDIMFGMTQDKFWSEMQQTFIEKENKLVKAITPEVDDEESEDEQEYD